MIFKKDNFVFGLALGLVAPIIAMLIYKMYKLQGLTITEMFQWFKLNPNLVSGFISVSLLANAILFTIYINGRRDNTAKGIFVLTIIYAAVAMIFKYY
ncbi:MAG: hypothetical protein ABIR31_02240 [Ginsengibacter sp.]